LAFIDSREYVKRRKSPDFNHKDRPIIIHHQKINKQEKRLMNCQGLLLSTGLAGKHFHNPKNPFSFAPEA